MLEPARKALEVIEGKHDTDTMRRARHVLRVFAPFYFILFIICRVYLEAGPLAAHPTFSYYKLFHHLQWFSIIMMIVLLEFHLILRVPIRKLMWLHYGASMTAFPLVYSWLADKPLQMSYLKGGPEQILFDILTFSLLSEENRPLSTELVFGFVALTVLGRAYTGKWRRGLLLATVNHLVGNMFAITWFGWRESGRVLVAVETTWGNHPFFAVLYQHMVLPLLLVCMWRGRLFESDAGKWWVAGFWGAFAWAAYVYLMSQAGYFESMFDTVMTGLPAFTVVFVIARLMQPDISGKTAWALLAMFCFLVVQGFVYVPVFGKVQHRYEPRPYYAWTFQRMGPPPYWLLDEHPWAFLEANRRFSFESEDWEVEPEVFPWHEYPGPEMRIHGPAGPLVSLGVDPPMKLFRLDIRPLPRNRVPGQRPGMPRGREGVPLIDPMPELPPG